MPVEVYYYENSYTLRGTKFIKNGTKLQEKLGQIVYNKFRPANCSHGYEVPIWIPFHIRSASKFKNDRQVPAGGALQQLCVHYLPNTVAVTDSASWKKVFESRP